MTEPSSPLPLPTKPGELTEPRAQSLVIYEIYTSVQGEATWAGVPCTFVRLAGCPLRCTYCDTEYAFYGGKRRLIADVIREVNDLGIPVVEVTGGEPLAQPQCPALLRALLDAGHTVLLETSGAYTTAEVPEGVHVILDMKCPSSGEQSRNDYSNLERLRSSDEVKFVMGTREDYEFARDLARQHRLWERCRAVLFSPVFGAIEPRDIVAWMLDDQLTWARFQLQMHKFIWPPDQRGV